MVAFDIDRPTGMLHACQPFNGLRFEVVRLECESHVEYAFFDAQVFEYSF